MKHAAIIAAIILTPLIAVGFLAAVFCVHAQVIPHASQNYDTVGNWWWNHGTLEIRVSRMSDRRYELLVGLHETIEALLCAVAGVREEDVTAFDVAYEAARSKGDVSEPGDDPRAPYRFAHRFASRIERVAAIVLMVRWQVYADEVDSL